MKNSTFYISKYNTYQIIPAQTCENTANESSNNTRQGDAEWMHHEVVHRHGGFGAYNGV